MKKVLALMLTMVLLLSLAACGGNNAKESVAGKTSSKAEQSDTVKETEQAPQEKVDVPENLVGTWYIIPSDYTGSAAGSGVLDKAEILSFTLIENGTISVDGKEYPLKNSSDNKSIFHDSVYGEYKNAYIVNIGNDQYKLGINVDTDNSNYIVFEPYGNKYANYQPLYAKKNYTAKTTELTLDNWKDFFEVKFDDNFGANKNEWGDVAGFYGGGLILTQKDNIKITGIQNGRIAYKLTITETAMAHFNKTTEKYSLSDTVTESNETFENESDLLGSSGTYGGYFSSISLGGDVGRFNDCKDAGDEFTARVATKGDLEVTRIMGTITYLTEE